MFCARYASSAQTRSRATRGAPVHCSVAASWAGNSRSSPSCWTCSEDFPPPKVMTGVATHPDVIVNTSNAPAAFMPRNMDLPGADGNTLSAMSVCSERYVPLCFDPFHDDDDADAAVYRTGSVCRVPVQVHRIRSAT